MKETIKNSVLLFIGIIFGFAGTAYADDWFVETVDYENAVGTTTSLELDSNGYPHIGYRQHGPDEQVRYAVWDGSNWDISVVESANQMAEFVALALGPSDVPHIAYTGPYPYPLKYAKWNGSSWDIELVDDVVAKYISIAVDSNGLPHISYADTENQTTIKYAHWNGSAWEFTTFESVGFSTGYTSITIDSSDYPCIAYTKSNDNTLKYARWNGSTWDISVAVGCTGRRISLALDDNDLPHVSHSNITGTYLAYSYYDGSTWVTDNIEECAGDHSSIALSPMGTPHISFRDYDELKMAFYYDSQWIVEVVDDSPWVGDHTSIEVDSSSIPHISYFDSTNNDLKYARRLTTDVEDDEYGNNPVTYKLHPAYPNPSRGSTKITFSIPLAADIELAVYDIKGRKVDTIAAGHYSAGEHKAEVTNLTAGIYLYRLEADNFADTRKMVVVE